MRIGLVTDYYFPWIAGPSFAVRNLGADLGGRGHSVAILAPSPDGARRDEWEAGLSVTRAQTVPIPLGYHVRVSSLPLVEAGRWLDAVRPDVINVHHPFPLSAAAIFAARRRTIPVVATNHTVPECSLWGARRLGPVYTALDVAFSRWIVYLLDRCDAVATPTQSAAEMLRALGLRREVAVISNGVDTERFKPGPPGPSLKRGLGLDDRPVVLYTGRLDPEKQMDVWLQAASLLDANDAQFVVGGKGADAARLRRLAHSLGIDRQVRFIGYVPEDQLPDLYRLADIYFVTSPVELQSIGTLEAVSSGLPVVAVRAGALPELVRDGHNGYLVPAGDGAAAARALQRLLRRERRAPMSEVSRQVGLGHDRSATVDAYERMLEGAIHQRRGVRQDEHAVAAGC